MAGHAGFEVDLPAFFQGGPAQTAQDGRVIHVIGRLLGTGLPRRQVQQQYQEHRAAHFMHEPTI